MNLKRMLILFSMLLALFLVACGGGGAAGGSEQGGSGHGGFLLGGGNPFGGETKGYVEPGVPEEELDLVLYVTSEYAQKEEYDGGMSWEQAYGYEELQTAIEDAKNQSYLLNKQCYVAVQQGTYTPKSKANIIFGSTTDKHFHFSLRNGVTVIGGYAGTENDGVPVGTKPTILSGDLNGNDDPEELASKDDNTYHVFFHPNVISLNETAELRNAEITGGYASFNGSNNNRGAGMFNVDCSPTLINCTFRQNTISIEEASGVAYALGGGLYNIGGNPKLENCTFIQNSIYASSSENKSIARGAGIYNEKGNPDLSNCVFKMNSISVVNSAEASGGGMYSSGGSFKLTNCIFDENIITSFGNASGGGMYSGGGSLEFIDCFFSKNNVFSETSEASGGGICNANSNSTFTDCTFAENSIIAAKAFGGGMYNKGSGEAYLCDVQLIGNCVFNNNSVVGTTAQGGAVYKAVNNYTTISGEASYGSGVNANTANEVQDDIYPSL